MTVKKVISELLSQSAIITITPALVALINAIIKCYGYHNHAEFTDFANIIQPYITLISARFEILTSMFQKDDTLLPMFARHIELFIYCVHNTTQLLKQPSDAFLESSKSLLRNIGKVMQSELSFLNSFLLQAPESATLETGDDLYEILGKPIINFKADMKRQIANISKTSRLWIHAKLQDWMNDPNGSRLFCIQAGPGMGKTALVSSVAYYYSDIYNIYAIFYCKYGDSKASMGDLL